MVNWIFILKDKFFWTGNLGVIMTTWTLDDWLKWISFIGGVILWIVSMYRGYLDAKLTKEKLETEKQKQLKISKS